MIRKSRFVLCIVLVLFTLLCGNLLYIMMRFPLQATGTQNSRSLTVANVRGTIYDVNLQPMVNQKRVYYAAVLPTSTTIDRLSTAVNAVDLMMLKNRLNEGTPATVRLSSPVGLYDDIRLFYLPERYSDRLLAPHILGYLDNAGQTGVVGIERAFDDVLSSCSGSATVRYAVDGGGRCLIGVAPEVTDSTGKSAGGVVLTLDNEIQRLVEETAKELLIKGAVCVIEPRSGEIRALASYPTFQPNSVAQSIADDQGALINRAIALYDCGSVFKIVTAAAALEQGVSSTQQYCCNGSLSVDGVRFHCHNRLGHGELDMQDALAYSCNLYFIQLAQQIGSESLYAMANALGFGRVVTLADGISASSPILPSRSELQASSAALANLSFGQGRLMVSPLHITAMMAAVVNDGQMPSLRLVKGTVDENLQLTESGEGECFAVLTPFTARRLQNMLCGVVRYGTGQAAQPSMCSAAGKTGTAETGQRSGEKPVVQSWFVGYFPAEDPQYIVTVLAEDAENTQVNAANIFCEISNKLYEVIGE